MKTSTAKTHRKFVWKGRGREKHWNKTRRKSREWQREGFLIKAHQPTLYLIYREKKAAKALLKEEQKHIHGVEVREAVSANLTDIRKQRVLEMIVCEP